MSKSKNFSNPADLVVHLYERGHTKDEIAVKLFEQGISLSEMNKVFKESKVQFRKTGMSTWKFVTANLFLSNPDATVDEMATALEGTVKDPLYYVKAYYDVFKYMANEVKA